MQWDVLAFGDLWCGRRRRGRCGRDSPPPYFVTILPLLPFPSLHAIPFTLPLPPPSPEGAVVQEDSDEARHLCPAGGGVWDEGGSSEVYPVLVTFSAAAQDHVDRLRGVETTPRGVCVGGGRRHHCVSVHSYQAVCMLGMAHCCCINMLHKSCCTAVLVLQLAVTVCAMFLCSCCPTEMRPSSFWPLLQWATFYYQSRQADRCVCVCVCVHAWASGKRSVRHFIFIRKRTKNMVSVSMSGNLQEEFANKG